MNTQSEKKRKNLIILLGWLTLRDIKHNKIHWQLFKNNMKHMTRFPDLVFVTNETNETKAKTKQAPVYSATEAIEDAVEAFSQSLSVFLLGFLLRMGKDSIDSTLGGK